MSEILNTDTFRQKFKEGTRQNRFKVHFDLIKDLPFLDAMKEDVADSMYFVTATNLPGQNIGEVSVNFAGRELKYAGNPEAGEWTCTFINDVMFKAHKMIESWMTATFDQKTQYHGVSAGYHRDLFISQLDNNGNIIATILMHNAYPKSLAEMAKSQETADFDTFDVGFNYDYRLITYGPDSLETIQEAANSAALQIPSIVNDLPTV